MIDPNETFVMDNNENRHDVMQEPWLFEHQLEDGPLIRFRHAVPADAEMIAASISTASPETLLHRFFTATNSVPLSSLRRLMTIDRPASLCLVGWIEVEGRQRIICGARFVRATPADLLAEFAVTVHDDFQRRGLGTLLMRQLCDEALLVDIVKLEGFILYSNTRMQKLISRLSLSTRWYYGDDMIRVVVSLRKWNTPPKATDLMSNNSSASVGNGGQPNLKASRRGSYLRVRGVLVPNRSIRAPQARRSTQAAHHSFLWLQSLVATVFPPRKSQAIERIQGEECGATASQPEKSPEKRPDKITGSLLHRVQDGGNENGHG